MEKVLLVEKGGKKIKQQKREIKQARLTSAVL